MLRAVTLVLVTDVGDTLCWRRARDIGDQIDLLVALKLSSS